MSKVKKTSKKRSKKLSKKVKPAKKDQVSSEPKITPYPEAGPKVQEFEDLLDSQLSGGPGTKTPKRGPGRPPKEKSQEPEQPELTIDVVAGVIKIPFELWAIGQDVKELALDDNEARQIAEPAKQLLEYYLPKIPVIAYAWISMSVSAFWIVRIRLLLIQEIRKLREKQQPARPAEPAQPGVTTKFPSETKTERV